MKLLITFLITTFSFAAFAQQDGSVESPSRSFEKSYNKEMPTLKYSYDKASETHDYSNNWDFDKDGINDELYFIGTGGAHLYYFLKVILSTDHKPREFSFLQSDFPMLAGMDSLNLDKLPFGFVVTDFGRGLPPTIIVRIDKQTFYDNKELKKRKINTRNVLVSFENGVTKYGCL